MVFCDVTPRLGSFLFHVFEYHVKGLAGGGVVKVFDRERMDIVRVVIVHHILILVSGDGSDWEGAGCICVQGVLVLISKRRKAKHVAYHSILWDHMFLT